MVRETMNRTLELWKGVPGVSEEVSVPTQFRSSSIGNNFLAFLLFFVCLISIVMSSN